MIDDNSTVYQLKDKEMIREVSNVLLIEDIFAQHPELTFNELQCMIFANSDPVVSLWVGILCFVLILMVNIIYA